MAKIKENIFLFVPNIIGFVRIFLAITAFYYMRTHYITAVSCYILSTLLDAFDGHAARLLNQSTKFGAMLDQLTDRANTAGLMMTLATFYPEYTFWLQLAMVIDITCHWLYLHTCTLQGKMSHKFIDLSENRIMLLYYTNKIVLFTMCAGNEAFYAGLYLIYFDKGPEVLGCGLYKVIVWLSMPIAVIKACISVLHGIVASLNLANIDIKEREAPTEKKN